jgi:hypothetical protein
VHVRGGDHVDGLLPAHPDQAALAASLLVAPAALRVADDVRPREHGVSEPLTRFPEHLDQHPRA